MRVSNRTSGQSLVEFSLGAIVLLLILSGAADFGRAYLGYLAVRDAATEGAVYASIEPADVAGIRDHVRASSGWPIDFSTLTDGQITVTYLDPLPACGGKDVKVKVETDFVMVAPLIGGRVLPLSAEVVYKILVPPC